MGFFVVAFLAVFLWFLCFFVVAFFECGLCCLLGCLFLSSVSRFFVIWYIRVLTFSSVSSFSVCVFFSLLILLASVGSCKVSLVHLSKS